MGYEKVTMAAFKEKLEAGGYKNLTGARKGIGRVEEWTEDEKNKARAMADKFFGAAPAKPAGKVGRPKGSKNKAKPVKPAKKAAKSVKVAKKATKKAPKKVKATKAKGPSPKVMTPSEALTHIGQFVGPNQELQTASYTVGTIQSVLECLKLSRELGAQESGVVQVAKASQQALLQVIEQVMTLTGVEETAEEKAKAEAFRRSVPKGNTSPHLEQPEVPITISGS